MAAMPEHTISIPGRDELVTPQPMTGAAARVAAEHLDQCRRDAIEAGEPHIADLLEEARMALWQAGWGG